VLVRDHGAYIWGEDLWEAKRHAEVYHFLFEAIVARARRAPAPPVR
jgi:ribulose-5-phosphate 4-epimerase/fuculose-1-phosphate aldolase